MIYPPDYVKMKANNAIALTKKSNNEAEPPYDYCSAKYDEYDKDTGKKIKSKDIEIDLVQLDNDIDNSTKQRDYWQQMLDDGITEKTDAEAVLA